MSGSFEFTLDNFHQYSQQLRVIIMSRQNHDPMTQFKHLEPKQQRLFNEELNKYIRALTITGDFEKKITEDFNYVCQEEIFPFLNTKYKNMAVRPSTQEELAQETKEYTELIFKSSMLDNELTETQLNKIPVIDK
jgi:hypothetical protein